MRISRVARWSVVVGFPLLVAAALVWVETPTLTDDPALGMGNVLFGVGFAVTAACLVFQPGQRGNAVILAAAAVGFVVDESSQRELGQAARWVWLAGTFVQPLIATVLLRYPGRRLDQLGRWFIGVNVVAAAVVGVALAATYPVGWGVDRPVPAGFSQALLVREVWWAAGAAVFVVLLVRRWLRLGRFERRLLRPIMVAAVVAAVLIGSALLQGWLPGAAREVLDVARSWVAVAISLSFVVSAAMLRWSMAGIGVLATKLSGAVTMAGVQTALQTALADPSARVLYWVPERTAYVDRDGVVVADPAVSERMAVRVSTRSGDPLAMIMTDPALGRHSALLDGAVAVSQLALEGASLEADLRFQLAETRQTRARLLHSGLEQRRQLERDLHDGAQQHLLAVAMRLGAAETQAGDPATAEAVRLARKELSDALAELRHLAHGIYPAELSQSGLRAAFETVTARLPIVIYLDVPDRRWAADVESAAYFVGCEALTNAAKHAAPCTAWLDVQELDGELHVTVRDDGQGATVLNTPMSLPGLRDRLAALGGTLQVHSDRQGTIVVALIPCG